MTARPTNRAAGAEWPRCLIDTEPFVFFSVISKNRLPAVTRKTNNEKTENQRYHMKHLHQTLW